MDVKYSIKFIWGVILIVSSFIIGIFTKILFLMYLTDKAIALPMLTLYIISWPMLILGVWWAGKEYAEIIKQYFRYKYYHKYVTAGAKKMVDTTNVVRARAKKKGDEIKNNVRVKINSEREKIRSRRKT